ncbi:MAG: ABC transporter, partial [Brevundimonas sp.]|nr:ABC transporter [Brevundimonas sp.]
TVFEALHRLVKDTGVAALIATHNMELAGHMDRVFALKDGHLEERPAESHAY